jgi:hypothetical protein
MGLMRNRVTRIGEPQWAGGAGPGYLGRILVAQGLNTPDRGMLSMLAEARTLDDLYPLGT